MLHHNQYCITCMLHSTRATCVHEILHVIQHLFFTFPGYDVTILSLIVSKDWYCDLGFCGSFTLFTGAAIVVSECFLLVVMWMPLSDECKNSLLKMKSTKTM